MPAPPGSAHLFPCEWWPKVPANPIIVPRVVLGREWAVDSEAYGKPYVFSKATPSQAWMIHAGPFTTEADATEWVNKL